MNTPGEHEQTAWRLPILMYHSVSAESSKRFAPFVLSPRLLAEHAEYLAENDYVTLTAHDVTRIRGNREAPHPRAVVITFDDAFADFASVAFPILQAARLSSTIFVPTAFVGGTSRWLVAEAEENRPILSWAGLGELVASGVDIGAHSHSHPQMDRLRRPMAAHEIALSKDLLEQHLQRAVTTFAYPFGYSRPTVRRLVRDLGFSAAFAVGDLVSRQDDDRFAIPRLTVSAGTTVQDLARMLDEPRLRRQELRSMTRAAASRVLRTAGLKKRRSAPNPRPRSSGPK